MSMTKEGGLLDLSYIRKNKAKIYTHRIPSPASLLESTKHAIHDVKSKCASATAVDMACGIELVMHLGLQIWQQTTQTEFAMKSRRQEGQNLIYEQSSMTSNRLQTA